MGLIKAAMGAIGSTLGDQWKEFFYCESMPKEVMVTKGQKRTSGRSSNRGSDNIISNGSGIAVADGQCMIIVEQGKVVELSAEPGEYTFDTSTEPSVFAGNLGTSILETFKAVGKRFTYGGDTGKDQRIYYFNTKELIDNKFGTKNPIPFRVVDSKINLDVDVTLRCAGVYSYRISDPMLFYSNVCGNVEREYLREEIEPQLKEEFISALQPAMAKLSAMELRPNQIIAHNTDLENAMREQLSHKWSETRGLEVVSVAIATVTLPPEDTQMIKDAQRTAMYRDPGMAGATLVGAQADAMKIAAGNSGGAAVGFMGMNMAMNAGGMNAQNFFAMDQQRQQQMQQQQMMQQEAPPRIDPVQGAWKCSCGETVTGNFCPNCGSKKPEPKPAAGTWQCSCGATVTGNFCPNCGNKKPAEDGWTCPGCGAVNKGKFCPQCGARKPAGALQYACDKCGWQPEDPAHPPKFCPMCGDPFDENDVK